MADRVLSPGELEKELTQRAARLAEAKRRVETTRRPRTFRRRTRIFGGAGVTAFLTLTIGVGLVFATQIVDLTTADSSATINGAIYTQGLAVPVSGTGVLDPFLRVQSNQNMEQGISTDTNGVLDETNSWTKALLLSNVPVIRVGSTNYREFLLDINQLNSIPKNLLSLDELKIFLTTTPNITSYVDNGLTSGGVVNGVTFSAYSGSGSRLNTMVFSQGDNIVKLNYSLEAGSGKPDLTVLIPDSVFGQPGDAGYCGYAQAGCNTWMGFYSRFGGYNGTNLSGTNALYPNNDGFEEWATIIRPVVNVTKTATATASKNCTWNIDKSVDDTEIDIADGGSATFNYTVSVTHSCTDTVNPVTGNIVITNPATLPDGTATSDATVTSVTDLFTPGNVSGTVSCPGGLPFTLTSGQSKTCTYTLNLGSATNGTNTATVTLSDTSVAPATASAAVNFTTTMTDESVTVVDNKTTGTNVTLGTVNWNDPSPTTFTYSLTKSGVAGTCTDYNNTATFTTNDTATTGSDSQKVTVCVGKDLTVSKTATPTFTRTYQWTIDKSVDKTHVDIAAGGTATFNYTVDVSHDSGTDSAWATSGTITVTNPNDWESITFDLADAVDNGGTCTITGGGTGITVAASSQVTKNYTCSWASAPSNASGTNTATATWNSATYHTPTGTASGTANFAFTTPTTLIDESVTVTDTNAVTVGNPTGLLGTATYTDANPKEFTYSVTRSGVAGTCTNYDNTATFTTNDTATTGSDSVRVTVCVGQNLSVSKTAAGTFDRLYLWDIAKNVDDTEVDIAEGGTATFNFTVTVTQTGVSDSGWEVHGKITISNPNDWEAITLSGLTDAVDNGGTCTVDAGPYVIPASGSLDVNYTCSYASAPSSYSGTNTATATWSAATYHTPAGTASGTANFTLAQDGSTNKTVTVTDTNAVTAGNPTGELGTVTGTDSAPFTTHDFTYSVNHGGVAGTCTDYDNTATIVETNDTADKEVTVCVGKDLTVSKTATPAFTRTYAWTIDKSVDHSSVTINNGDSYTFNYSVSVSHNAGTDSAWQVTGSITVTNPNDWESITFDLADTVDNGGTCSITGGGSSITVAASSTVTKNYTCTWASAPSASSGTNTATATWSAATYHTPTGSASGTANFAFTSPTSVVDECVNVTDTFGGTLGTVCVGDANPTTFTYSRTITPSDYTACGTFTYDNTATFTTNDTGATGSDSQTVSVTVINCGVPGKTPGFWRSNNGHAILDANHDGLLDTPVTIGAGSNTFTVTTIAQSDKILSNNDCGGGSPHIYTCNGPSGLLSGINTNSFEVLGAQTLALTYNIGNISGFSGQTLSALGVNAYITSALTGLGVTPSTTVNQLLTIANNLIDNCFKPSGTATQAQVGAMNTLLSQVNREVL